DDDTILCWHDVPHLLTRMMRKTADDDNRCFHRLSEKDEQLCCSAKSKVLTPTQRKCSMSADGFCAMITGASSGLGAATALGLVAPGVRLVINYASNRDGAEATAERCRAAGAEAVVVQGDVSRDEDCRA